MEISLWKSPIILVRLASNQPPLFILLNNWGAGSSQTAVIWTSDCLSVRVVQLLVICELVQCCHNDWILNDLLYRLSIYENWLGIYNRLKPVYYINMIITIFTVLFIILYLMKWKLLQNSGFFLISKICNSLIGHN